MLGIIIPAYKRPERLREALRSLEIQTRKDFVVVIVDDHSPEPLEAVAQEFYSSLSYVYFYAEQNGGPGAARQIGLDWCYSQNFEYVMFLDSDDLFYPHTVERLLTEMENTGCEMISSMIWQESGPGCYGGAIPSNNETWLHGKIFRTDYLQEHEIRFPPIRTNEDVVFNLIASQISKKKGTLDEVLYLFRMDPNSLTRSDGASKAPHSTDYIRALYYVTTYMKEKFDKLSDQVVIDIFACYNHYQVGLYYDMITQDIIDKMYYMLHQEEIFSALQDIASLTRYVRAIQSYYILPTKVIFFKQSFYDWLVMFEMIQEE